MSDMEDTPCSEMGFVVGSDWDMEEDGVEDECASEEVGFVGPPPRGKQKGSRKKIPVASCLRCTPKRYFYSLNGYKVHLKRHLFEEMLRTAPILSAVKAECQANHREILHAILNEIEKYSAGLSTQVKNIVSALLAQDDNSATVFSSAVSECLWECIPSISMLRTFDASEFHRIYQNLVNQLLCGQAREDLLHHLKSVVDFPQAAGHWFLTKYVMRMSSKCEVFYLKSLREPREMLGYGSDTGLRRDLDRDNLEDSDMQGTIYYVGGSVVRSVLGRAIRSLGNPKWAKVDTFIRTKVLVGDLTSGPDGSVVEWTKAVDRGGLKYIGEPMWNFLMGFSGILRVSEKKDGSVIHDEVLDAVKDDPGVMFLWHEVVEQSLTEEESAFLLEQVCYFFTNAWGRGVALRHRNAIKERPKHMVALRAGLELEKSHSVRI